LMHLYKKNDRVPDNWLYFPHRLQMRPWYNLTLLCRAGYPGLATVHVLLVAWHINSFSMCCLCCWLLVFIVPVVSRYVCWSWGLEYLTSEMWHCSFVLSEEVRVVFMTIDAVTFKVPQQYMK
jgi:hypothetical protein